VFLAVVLLVPILAACGDDDEGVTVTVTETATATAGATSTTATSTTQPPPSQEPVKIGAICPWSGPAAMAGMFYGDPIIEVVEKQVEESGGILGGRPLQIKKYDSKGTVADAFSAATKAIVGDKLSVVAWGGISGTEATAVAEVACEEDAFFSSCVPVFDVPERECMVAATISMETLVAAIPALITERLQPTPKTAAILAVETAQVTQMLDGWKSGYEGAGIETVFEEIVGPDTQDFSPQLTRIKYENPDVLICYLPTASYMAVATQIVGLGGWGDIQVVTDPVGLTAAGMSGTEGWISVTPWFLDMDNDESRKFIQDYEAIVGKPPDVSHVYFYFSMWTAIHAMELAGTAEDGDSPLGRTGIRHTHGTSSF